MGEHDTRQDVGNQELRTFMRAVLDDVHALERMIESGLIESGIRRIGAEQEIFLVDENWRPKPCAMDILKRLGHPQFTTELALFNLEANLLPQPLNGACLRVMEDELNGLLERVHVATREDNGKIVLTGILPTLTQADLGIEAMTPIPRYRELNDALIGARGGEIKAYIKGVDELSVTHGNVLFEACNTSFQVHFQVGAHEFARLYNLAQAVTPAVLAAAVNSPVVLQHRLWHETRIALFQQSVDERSEAHLRRGRRPRVSFGDSWVKESVLEIFREDIARFRLLLTTELGDRSTEVLDRGGIPELKALRLHNGTVYRWNRACYGVADGKAHLRIENRALPAGPTVRDEIANAAFFFGLMSSFADEHEDITKVMDFDDCRGNFTAAARQGLKAQFRWLDGRDFTASDLILDELLPKARKGLELRKIDSGDIETYLGVIEARVQSGQTGSQWALDSLSGMRHGTRDVRYRSVVASTYEQQWGGKAVHEWTLAKVGGAADWRSSYQTVGQVMTTDVFTVHPEDVVDLAASLMEWEHIRHVPVEDNDGKLVGIVSHRTLLRLLGRGVGTESKRPVAVREIMKPAPLTVRPETSVLESIDIMRKHKVSCLPITTAAGQLLGIVTERDFLDVAARLFEERLRG